MAPLPRQKCFLQRSNKIISLELKRCHLGAYYAEEAHHHRLQRRKMATKFHKRTEMWNVGWGLSPVEVNDKPIIHKLIHSLVILGLLFGIMMFIRIIVGATFYRLFRNISMSTINKLDFLITLPARYSKADIENKAMVKWTSKGCPLGIISIFTVSFSF